MKYKRLKFIASLVKDQERVLDVGTDHALLPIKLIEDGVTSTVTASDVNEEPLKIAKENIINSNLQDKIQVKLMNGIEDIGEDDFDCIIIAGMGGNTISEIIKQKNFNGRYIIHSTTNLEELRKTIYEIGHSIKEEYVVFEGKIHNVIIETIKQKGEINEKEIFMGPSLIKKDDESIMNYYKFLLDIFEQNVILSKNENLKINERKWIKEKIWNE